MDLRPQHISLFFVLIASRFGNQALYVFRMNVYEEAFEHAIEGTGVIIVFFIAFSFGYYPFAARSASRIEEASVPFQRSFNSIFMASLIPVIIGSTIVATIMAMNDISIHNEDSLTFGGPFRSFLGIIAKLYLVAPALAYVFWADKEKVRRLAMVSLGLIVFCVGVGFAIGLKTAAKQGLLLPVAFLIVGMVANGVAVPKKLLAVASVFGLIAVLFIQEHVSTKASQSLIRTLARYFNKALSSPRSQERPMLI